MKRGSYDILVIGSGIGGMCVAALLAHLGYKTLVIERLPEIGGRFSTLEYQGYKVPTGGFMIPATGTFKQLFDEVGAEFEVCTVPPPIYLIEGKEYRLPPKGQFRAILAHMCKGEAELSRIADGLRRVATWKLPSNEISLRDWLIQYTDNERVLELFNNLSAGYIIANSWEASARAFFQMRSEVMSGYALPGFAPQGNIVLMESLARVVRGKGGDVWTRCAAKEILVAGGSTQGAVVDKDGKGEIEIAVKAVISNTGPKETVRLAGSENFEKGYLREVSNMISGIQFSAVTVSDRPLYDVPVLETLMTRRLIGFNIMTLVCPQLAPPGKHLHLSVSAPRSMVEPCDFRKEADLHVQDLSDNIPGFDEYGEVLHMGCFRGDWPVIRNIPYVGYPTISPKTPVENLYNVGDGVGNPWYGGTAGCAVIAKAVADDIKARIKPG